MRALLLAGYAAALTALATPALAQDAPASGRRPTAEALFRPGSVAISLYGGGAAFSDFQRGVAQPVGELLFFRRRLSATTTAGAAAEVMTWIRPALGVRLNAAWFPTRFDVMYDSEGTEYIRLNGLGQGREWRRLNFWTADAAALIRPPFSLGRVAPYAIIGAGLATYQLTNRGDLPPEAVRAFAEGARTSWTVVAGLGAVVPLQRRGLLLSFALTDHIMRTPLNQEPGSAIYEDDGLMIEVADPAEAGSDGVSNTSQVRLMVGLTLPVRSVGP
jgi:hypothetical protein